MAYNQNIPQPGDQIKNSQPQILANFQEINTALSVNHVGFNLVDVGKHKFIQMPQQGADASTSPTEWAMYTKEGLYSGATETVLRMPNDSSVLNITEKFINDNTAWYQLPCGIIVKCVTIAIEEAPASPGLVYDFEWPIPNMIPFTQAPFNYSFCFAAEDDDNIRLVASADMTKSTNLRFYGRLSPSSSTTVNIPAFKLIVTAYGV